MPDVRSLFDKEYLYAFDLQGRDVTVRIVKVLGGKLVGQGGKSNKKPILYFEGKEKGLAINITNARTIAAMYGGSFKSEDWIGKWITLYPTTTTFGSATVECIRIRPEIPKSGQQSTTSRSAPAPRPAAPAATPPEQPPPPPEDEARERGDEPSPEEWEGAGR